MGKTELHIGKLKKISINGYSLEELCEAICKCYNIKNNDGTYLSWYQALIENRKNEYVAISGNLYYIENDKLYDIDEFMNVIIKNNDDNSIVYIEKFHNSAEDLVERLQKIKL